MQSWGRVPRARDQVALPIHWRSDALPRAAGRTLLPYGRGRSYGDVCLNEGGALLVTSALDRFISFDEERGLLCCEAGAGLDDVLRLCVPRGWFLPVTPGTKQVTIGGAIANDVHGKNHHRAGPFGRHVTRLELLRSDGRRIVCRPGDEWFEATVGGLGLTGLILWAEVRLRRIASALIDVETLRFEDLDGFLELSAASDAAHEYTVAWIDCTHAAGRGVFFRGDHAREGKLPDAAHAVRGARLSVPFDLPRAALARPALRLFNSLYRAAHRPSRALVHYEPFFYPLDAVRSWNRLYGARGFFQFQCVVPEPAPLRGMLAAVARSGRASFLAVLKRFGDLPSPGMLSFPRPGLTLALDFPNDGAPTLALLAGLERAVLDAGGALYPAKDAAMSRAAFAASFPRVAGFKRYVDPAFSSSLWRRLAA